VTGPAREARSGAPQWPPVERAPVIYRLAQFIARNGWRLAGGIRVEGRENIPAEGPFLLIANHQSFLDPVFVQAVIRRPVYAMAKSTQFTDPIVGWLMRHILSFPVRRYQVDAHAVRTAHPHHDEGRGVAIYIEGERTWDGRLQEPKPGTARLALRAGVPIIPCVVRGTYEIWPRWASRPARGTATIRFLEPLHLPHLTGPANRAATGQAARAIMRAIENGLGTSYTS
jgi:1-acyl-sn-glycerol-3-phosphate acyltransferase